MTDIKKNEDWSMIATPVMKNLAQEFMDTAMRDHGVILSVAESEDDGNMTVVFTGPSDVARQFGDVVTPAESWVEHSLIASGCRIGRGGDGGR